MLGLGKLIGGALNAIGLGKIAPFISIGISFLTGDIAGLITDVTGLLSTFKGFGFLNRVAQFAPLGGFGDLVGGCFGDLGLKQFLKADNLRGLADRFFDMADAVEDFEASSRRVREMFEVLIETAQNRESLESVRSSVTYNSFVSVGQG